MKKIICFVLISMMMLTACSKQNVEISDPIEPNEINPEVSSKTSETEEEISSGLKIIQERADNHIFEYEFQYN